MAPPLAEASLSLVIELPQEVGTRKQEVVEMARDNNVLVVPGPKAMQKGWRRLLRRVVLAGLLGLIILPLQARQTNAASLEWVKITGTNYAGSSCSTVSSLYYSQILTAPLHPSVKWTDRITINFCYLSAEWSYVKSIKHEFWVSGSRCILAWQLTYGNGDSGYATLWDGRKYCSSSSSNYAGGRTFTVGKWIGHGQANGRLDIELEDYSYINSSSPNTEWRGLYNAIWYK